MVLQVISDERWAVLEPLLNEVRPWAARPIHDLRRTIEAIVWRHDNGAEWRSIPLELGPWWRAAQTFIRWSKLGVWSGCSAACRSVAASRAAWCFSTAP